MSKRLLVTTQCDWEDCEVTDQTLEGESVEIRPTDVLVYVRGRGRPARTITVDLCSLHASQMKTLYQSLARHDQSGEK